MSSKPKSGYVDVDWGRLFYEEAGEGQPLVLLHAGLWDRRIFDPQFATFADRYRTIRYDLRGYGRSSLPETPYSHVEDLRQLMEALDVEGAVLLGVSMGGRVSIDFTLELPAMVRALIPVASGLSGFTDPNWTPDQEAILGEAQAAARAGDLRRASDLELRLWTPLRTDPEVDRRIREIATDNLQQITLDEGLEQGIEPPASDRLSEIRVPTLLITGAEDVDMMERIADLLVGKVAGAAKVRLQRADHLPNMRRPGAFNRVVLDFLERLGSGPPDADQQ